jgi:hypothetical protein
MSQLVEEIPEIRLSWGSISRAAFAIDSLIGLVTEAVGAALVVVEICILFTGVVSAMCSTARSFGPTSSARFCSCGW